ncbi:MAG: penicillin-binding protein activator [Patescibacteria group bacterium]|nr:penicillin-binding protein activator [Patescibacteria group bacterium]
MNKWLVTLVIIIVVIGGYFVWNAKKTATTDTPPIKIGVIAPLSGIVADYGEEIRKGVLVAQKYDGIEFIFEDDKCEPKEAVSAFQKLANIDKVKFIIGPACGSSQEAIISLLAQNDILAIVPSAASKELFTKSGNNFLNTQYALEDESKFIADTLYQKDLKKVALITYGNAFSKTHADSFKKNFKGTIAVDTVILDDNANIQTELTRVKAAKVDAIYAPDISFFFAGGTVKVDQLGLKVPLYTTYVAELPAARLLVEGVIYSFPGNLTGTEGAVFELSKQSVEILVPIVLECKTDVSCVKEKLASSGKFDNFGTIKRPIILKQIKDAQPVMMQ